MITDKIKNKKTGVTYNIQWVPEVSEHPREPYGNTSFSRRSHYLNFRRNATNFCLELAR